MKKFSIVNAILITLCSSLSFAAGSNKFSVDDLVFKCNRTLSDGKGVYAHILSDEAKYDKKLGTYDIENCVSAYHSCFNVVDESGWGFNSMTISLVPTGHANKLQLKEAGSPMNGVICNRIK